jgi:RND family efflux transporter MFP subunit
MKLEVDSSEGQLETAQNELSLKIAPPRQEDIDLYQAQVKQAQVQINLIKSQIQEAEIKSPTDGQVTKIEKRIGEIVQSSLVDSVISLIPADPFQIEVDIYEEDIVRINVGNPVDITLTALPEDILKGKVIEIDPAEKIIENVVYYKVTIDFENPPEKIKPGMTADIVITTLSKESVLVIPEAAIEKQNGEITVRVLNGKDIEERRIEIGLKGNDDMVEVVYGLQEGERIAVEWWDY